MIISVSTFRQNATKINDDAVRIDWRTIQAFNADGRWNISRNTWIRERCMRPTKHTTKYPHMYTPSILQMPFE